MAKIGDAIVMLRDHHQLKARDIRIISQHQYQDGSGDYSYVPIKVNEL